MSQDASIAAVASRTDLGAMLLEVSSLTEEQLEEARKERETSGGRLSEHLLSAGHVSADEVMEALSRQLGLPIRGRVSQDDVDSELLERLPITFAKERGVLPLGMSPDGSLRVAVVDPLDSALLDDLRLLFDVGDVELELVTQRTLLGAINEVYDRGPGLTDALAEDAAEDLDSLATEISHEPQDLIDSGDDDAPIVKLVNSLLQTAVKERARARSGCASASTTSSTSPSSPSPRRSRAASSRASRSWGI
jgi:general secretion pathway protein E